MLLFRAELMRATLPELAERSTATASVPISTLVTAASQAEPGYHAVRLFLPATKRDAVFVQLTAADGTSLYICRVGHAELPE